jgi:hypothetical protein
MYRRRRRGKKATIKEEEEEEFPAHKKERKIKSCAYRF